MKKLKYAILGLSAIGMVACHSSQERAGEVEDNLTPVEPADQQRYNINQPTEEVINLDTASTDTTLLNKD